jgi:hypothetical protein
VNPSRFGEMFRAWKDASEDYHRTYNGRPVQEGAWRVSGLVRGEWHVEHVPTREQAAERLRVYLAWGATTVSCSDH